MGRRKSRKSASGGDSKGEASKESPSEEAAAAGGDAATPPGPADANSSATPEKKKLTVREGFESVVGAIILALIIRHFSLEAFEIPTGSMAPALHGLHADSKSPYTGIEHAISVQTDQEDSIQGFGVGYMYAGPDAEGRHVEQAVTGPGQTIESIVGTPSRGIPDGYSRASFREVGSAYCPHTGERYSEIVTTDEVLAGHKILVDKVSYLLREPRRWEVIVFKFSRERNYIKRLVGLPGESIQVQYGDIEIDGEIVTKPDWAQDQLWFPVYDSDVLRSRAGTERVVPVSHGWESRDGAKWESEEGCVLRLDGSVGAGVVDFTRGIYNEYTYNSPSARSSGRAVYAEIDRDYKVRDLRVHVELFEEPKSGSLAIGVLNGDGRIVHEAVLPFGGGEAEVRVLADEEVRLREKFTAPSLDAGDEVSVEVVDRHVRVRFDGDVIHEVRVVDEELVRRTRARESAARIEARGGNFAFSRVEIVRDIHYTTYNFENDGNAVSAPFAIDEDRYFAMGDNSPSSLDSRRWGSLTRSNLLGRALFILWPLPDMSPIR